MSDTNLMDDPNQYPDWMNPGANTSGGSGSSPSFVDPGPRIPTSDPYSAAPQQNAAGVPSWWDQGTVNGWFQQFLGRDAPGAGDPSMAANYANPGQMSGLYQTIVSSPEAQAYQARPKTPAPPTPDAPPPPPPPAYRDPNADLLSQYALDRFNQRLNPNPNSGTSLYESYARELMDKLKGPAYSDADAQVLKANAYDSMEQERSATKKRYMEEISRRGFAPSSGVALDGLLKIDHNYDGLRSQVDRNFATQAMEAQRQNQIQALQVAMGLASEEEGRQSDALNFAMVPYNMNNDAFSRNLQTVNAGGSPLSMLNGLIGAGNYGQSVSQNKAASTNGLMQYLGFILGL